MKMRPHLESTLPRRPLCLALLLCSGLLAGHAVAQEGAAEAAPESPPVAAPEAAPAGQSYSLSLRQLGRLSPINLQGTESSDVVNFGVRADQVVTHAQLALDYSYSPALLPELSQINVLVNEQVAASLALPREGAGTPQHAVVDIPPQLITEFNRLRLQFIGHYNMGCEDPLHSSLWAKIGNDSELRLNVTPLPLKDDLAILPLPLFDRRDSRQVDLPLVFAQAPDATTLEAAGALSSWIGALAAYRGAHFSARVGQLPREGNALVMVLAEQARELDGLSIPAADGPTVALLPNPHDGNAKVLVISGRNGEELKRAADAVALGSNALVGERVVIDQLQPLAPRKPYDAPNWLPTDRPVRLGELIEADRLSIAGYNPGSIRVPLQLPPDLFNWREDGAPLDLKYRYTPQQLANNSSLLVSFNERFVKAMPLPSEDALGGAEKLLRLLDGNDALPRETEALVPLASAEPRSQLNLRFMFDYVKEGDCRDIIIDNMRGMIDPDSTLDLSHYNHFIALPNLGVFNDSGFPFTRLADLSQTAVVLPDNSGPQDWSAYLTILGRFGQATGYPATAVRVVSAAQIDSVAQRDLLVLASGDNQPLLKAWAQYLPAVGAGAEHRFRLSDLALRLRDWTASVAHAEAGQPMLQVSYSGADASTFLSGFESPLTAGRSVVVISAGSPARLGEATAAMLGGDDYQDSIQGSLAVISGHQITSLVAEEQYYVGNLSLFKRVQWTLSQHPLWMTLVTLGGLILVSALLYLWLRQIARKRLA